MLHKDKIRPEADETDENEVEIPVPYSNLHACVLTFYVHNYFMQIQAHYHRKCLKPNFTGNADFIDTDDVFAPVISRRKMWIGGFPVLERPSEKVIKCLRYVAIRAQ